MVLAMIEGSHITQTSFEETGASKASDIVGKEHKDYLKDEHECAGKEVGQSGCQKKRKHLDYSLINHRNPSGVLAERTWRKHEGASEEELAELMQEWYYQKNLRKAQGYAVQRQSSAGKPKAFESTGDSSGRWKKVKAEVNAVPQPEDGLKTQTLPLPLDMDNLDVNLDFFD